MCAHPSHRPIIPCRIVVTVMAVLMAVMGAVLSVRALVLSLSSSFIVAVALPFR